MEVPLGWFLGTIAALCGCICTLASVIFSSLNSRITSQSRVITDQAVQMEAMRKDIERLSGGCGVATCLWVHRRPSIILPPTTTPPSQEV
ncbi:hypothetical protein OKA04_12295 [Luteolibacter flavescens]|uniref:Uncharacterized protein n=1 Tax=Luteolibacter flavescens TaxID=1859460 RepID=A0ABT3FPL3_9BACT|nr:hypothetical protein [Luteolibacter flavescens]MCW1885511.1 hypothetical protein [Luteolibacter flavescens]